MIQQAGFAKSFNLNPLDAFSWDLWRIKGIIFLCLAHCNLKENEGSNQSYFGGNVDQKSHSICGFLV